MLKSPGTTCWPVTKPSHFFKHSLQWGVTGHWVGRPKTRRGVSSVQQAVQLQRQGWAPHLSLAHQACSAGKPLAGCLRMTTEATGASICSPMVLMAKGELRSPISYWGGVPGKDCTLEMAQIVPNTEQGCGLCQLREVWMCRVKRWWAAHAGALPGDMTVNHSCFLTRQPDIFLQLSASLAFPQDW